MCAKQTGQIFYFESERMKFNDTQKKYKRYTTRWITNTFKVPAKKKKQQITSKKTAKQLWRIMKLISETVRLFLDPHILILCIILRLIHCVR